MFSVPTVMRGSFLSWSASVCSVCACTGLPSIRNPAGKPPAGGFSVMVSPSRCSTPRCAGPLEGRWILLSLAEPTALSPGSSHSSPASASHPSGFCNSAACCSRHEVISRCRSASRASAAEARRVESGTAISGCPVVTASIASANANAIHGAITAFFGSVVIAIVSVSCATNAKRYVSCVPQMLFRHLQENDSMLRHFRGVGILHRAKVLVRPQISQPGRGRRADGFEVQRDLQRRFASIEQRRGLRAIRQRLHPNLERPFIPYSMALYALPVLVHRDHFWVRQDGFRLLGHAADVVPSQQRRGQNGPQRHMRQILLVLHPAVPDFQHIGIVPVSGSGEFSQSILREAD